jgi:hypothetical protein
MSTYGDGYKQTDNGNERDSERQDDENHADSLTRRERGIHAKTGASRKIVKISGYTACLC